MTERKIIVQIPDKYTKDNQDKNIKNLPRKIIVTYCTIENCKYCKNNKEEEEA